MIKIVVLTGSFNPVTRAHYEILSDAVNKCDADEGLFVLTSDKYLAKKNLVDSKCPSSFMLSEDQRSELIYSLKADNPKLSCWGVELGGSSSNTCGTLRKILRDKKKQYTGEEVRLYYLFGADKLRQISHWKDAGQMINLCEYLVYARNLDIDSVINDDPFLSAHRDRIHFMSVDSEDLEDVSSTEVRRRFFAGEDYRPLMNAGPYSLLKKMSPADFPSVTPEDVIKAFILYGGGHGRSGARKKVYKSNCDIFNSWNMPSLGNKKEHQKAKVYSSPVTVNSNVQDQDTFTDCVNADCVDVAENLLKEGFRPAILNLASIKNPCGGYHDGFNAQEESLARMSTLSQSLYQFGNPKYKRFLESGTTYVDGVYPMDINYGGIYSPCVTFFRNNEDKYYSLRESTFDCPVISVASLSNVGKTAYTNDEREYFETDGYLTEEGRVIESNKIRTVFRIALDNGHDSIVLGAFGCGENKMMCDEVAALFRTVLEEPEFINRFKKLVFAIYEGKPTKMHPDKGRDGKFKPFYDMFESKE